MKKLVSLFLLMTLTLTALMACTPDEPTPPEIEKLYVSYDDRYEFAKEVASFDEVTVTSKIAGSDSFDAAVATMVEGSGTKAIITGCGSVKVNFSDGTSAMLYSEPAKLSVLLLLGQSNMEGYDGDAAESIKSPEGTVYSTYAESKMLTSDNYAQYMPESLTSDKNILGDELEYKLNSLTTAGAGKKGMDGAIAREWIEKTGEKVWLINLSHQGTSIKRWDKQYNEGDVSADTNGSNTKRNQYKELSNAMAEISATLDAEIAAGHYTLSHYGMLWMQGESDSYEDFDNANNMSAEDYTDAFVALHNNIKNDFKLAGKSIEFSGIIATRAFHVNEFNNSTTNNRLSYSEQDTMLTDVRMAQFYMGLNNEGKYADIYLASNAGDRFVGSNGNVLYYFMEQYNEDDAAFEARFGYAFPGTMAEMHHDGPHFTQKGFNEIGTDAVRNILYMRGIVSEAPSTLQKHTAKNMPNICEVYKAGTYSGMSLEQFKTAFGGVYY